MRIAPPAAALAVGLLLTVPACRSDWLDEEAAHQRDLEALQGFAGGAADTDSPHRSETERLEQARADARAAVERARTAGDARGEAEGWRALGTAYLFLGMNREAAAAMRTSAARYRDIGDAAEAERSESMLRMIRAQTAEE